MRHRVEVVALCCLMISMAGYQTVRSQVVDGDRSEKRVEGKDVRAFVAGHVVLSDVNEFGKVESHGTNTVHKSESSETVLFAVVGSGYVPANLNSTGTLKDENDGLGKESGLELPTEYALYQNFPNPFNPSTTIRFDLPEESNVTITVYDVLGRALLSRAEQLVAGRHRHEWDGRNAGGVHAASGVYFYRIEAQSLVGRRSLIAVRKMMLVR